VEFVINFVCFKSFFGFPNSFSTCFGLGAVFLRIFRINISLASIFVPALCISILLCAYES